MLKSIFYSSIFLLFMCNWGFGQTVGQMTYENEIYKINFPGQFEKNSQTLASNVGQLLMAIISYEPKSIVKDSNYVYMLLDTDYPDSTIHSDKVEMLDDFFAGAINGGIKNVNGKLLKETKGMTGIYPNRTIEIDYQNGLAIIKMTIILIKSKLIVLQTITNTQSYPNAASANFLNSFIVK